MTSGYQKTTQRDNDARLRHRAASVIPGGMYGHMLANDRTLPPSYPQFYSGGKGPYATDVDENQYTDFLCAFGPMLLGHRNAVVDQAAARQAQKGDTLSGPTPRMIELAEIITETVAHADWAMFAKNGTDATSMSVRIAREATSRTKLLKATSAYHGANEWFTPRMAGVTPEDRANIVEFEYNSLASLESALVEHAGQVAAVIVTPFRHDAYTAQEDVDTTFARGVRDLVTRNGAVLILDEVRSGFRLDSRGAWERLEVQPDLTAYSKSIANGYALAAVVGSDSLREAASAIYATGSFWYSAVAMAAGIATIEQVIEQDAPARIREAGERWRSGLEKQARTAGVPLTLTGPPQMPLLVFDNDPDHELAFAFTDAAVRRGVLLHPWHNMFLSTAHTDEVIDNALERTVEAFDEIVALHSN